MSIRAKYDELKAELDLMRQELRVKKEVPITSHEEVTKVIFYVDGFNNTFKARIKFMDDSSTGVPYPDKTMWPAEAEVVFGEMWDKLRRWEMGDEWPFSDYEKASEDEFPA